MNFKPINKNFITKLEMTGHKGSIILPNAQKARRAEVVAASDECSVKPGDLVDYGRFVDERVTIDGVEYLKMEEDDILMVNGACVKDRVLIRPFDVKEKIGSIILPDSAKPKADGGMVVDLGRDVKELRINDTVRYRKDDGMPIEINGAPFIMMRECDVLGVQ